MKREMRYLVLKLKDMDAALSESEKETALQLSGKISGYRTANGKDFLQCVVVESDWPEYEPTWQAIEARVTGIQPRTRKDYAIEHAEYMAVAAENYMNAMNAALTEDTDLGDCKESISDAWQNLKSMIFEFRKRAARA